MAFRKPCRGTVTDCVFVCKGKKSAITLCTEIVKYLELVDGGHIGLETKTLLKQKLVFPSQ